MSLYISTLRSRTPGGNSCRRPRVARNAASQFRNTASPATNSSRDFELAERKSRRVPVYAYELPEDLGSSRGTPSICYRQSGCDVTMFTTSQQVVHLMQIAARDESGRRSGARVTEDGNRFDRSYHYRRSCRIWIYSRPGALPSKTWDPGEGGRGASRVDPMAARRAETGKTTTRKASGLSRASTVRSGSFCRVPFSPAT